MRRMKETGSEQRQKGQFLKKNEREWFRTMIEWPVLEKNERDLSGAKKARPVLGKKEEEVEASF